MPTRAAKLPAFIPPALATLVDEVPTGSGWLFELKFDGYRCIAAASGKQARCYSRNGLDWTGRYGAIPDALAALMLDGALLDGEVVALDSEGRSSFSLLQQRLTAGGVGLSYFVFDLLRLGGEDLRPLPLVERKNRLQAALSRATSRGPIFYSDHIAGDGQAFYREVCRRQAEGVIAKRADSVYRSERLSTWLKVKCLQEDEFVVIGYTISDRPGRPFASLLLATRDNGSKLTHVGRVGTGWDAQEMVRVAKALLPLRRDAPTVDRVLPAYAGPQRQIRWVEPELVAQVAYAEVTADGALRHPSYRGLREDKTAAEVQRESPAPTGRAARARRLTAGLSDAAATLKSRRRRAG
jgi:bifunctional non-homologous end joining protein LigD